MTRVDAGEVMEMMQRSNAPPIINVLPEAAYRRRHIPDSINIPLESPDFAERVEAEVEDLSDPVIVYCAGPGCDASERAARALEDAGFTNVHDFSGGAQDWEEAGYELAGTEAATQP